VTATSQSPYRPLYKPNQLLCGTGQVAIVTGWTRKDAVGKHLAPSEYAAIGQLYSPARGVNLLARNLLLNPQVRFLVVLEATAADRNAGACRCLLDFFRNGFTSGTSDAGQPCWVVRSPVAGYLDGEIPAAALTALRQSVACRAASSIAEAIEQARACAQQGPLPPWGEPQQFPMPEATPTVYPGPRYGHRIEGRTIAETWIRGIHRVKTTGTIRPTAYDGQWQELIDLMAIVTAEPERFYFPEPNYLPIGRPFIQDYINEILADAAPQAGVQYTYGQRLRSWFGRDQIEQAIQTLTADPHSTRAVMSLWDVQDGEASDSPPCLNHVWLRLVEGELSLTATFRSNDLFSAWPANAMGLRALQQHVRDRLNASKNGSIQLGPLITLSQSAHIYDDCWESADRTIREHYPQLCRQRHYADPSGNFIISMRAADILVERTTPHSGETVAHYTGTSAQQLYREIAADCPSLQVEHALYLGTELQKAETVLRAPERFRYEQDRPLADVQND